MLPFQETGSVCDPCQQPVMAEQGTGGFPSRFAGGSGGPLTLEGCEGTGSPVGGTACVQAWQAGVWREPPGNMSVQCKKTAVRQQGGNLGWLGVPGHLAAVLGQLLGGPWEIEGVLRKVMQSNFFLRSTILAECRQARRGEIG